MALDLGIQHTEEFSVDGSNPLEDFLSGTVPLEKIDPKKKEAPSKKEATPVSKDEKKEEDEEEEIDLLATLDNEEEEEENPEEKTKEPEKEDEPSKTEFEVISEQLLQLGIFSEDEEALPKTAEQFAERFRDENQKGAVNWLENFLSQHGEDRRELFDAIFVSGVDPKEYIPVFNQVQDFEGLDTTLEENQKKVFREYYKRLNWDAGKIETKLQKAVDYGDLAEDTEDMLQKIVEQDKATLEEQKLKKDQATAQKKQIEQQYKASVQQVLLESIKTKELDGYPLTEARAKEVADILLTPKYKLPNGDVITEFDKWMLESKKPENIKDRILFATLKAAKFDFSKIEKKAVSKESNELFAELRKKSAKNTTKSAIPAGPSAFDTL